MKRLLSLFDYSGTWSSPFEEAGYDVIRWDIKIGEFMDINLIEDAESALELFENVDGILAAAPCTDFTKSGAQYWIEKDGNGSTAASLEMIYQVQRLADLFTPTDPDYDGTFFWALENPVGRLPKLNPSLGAYYKFHPHEFSGYMNPNQDVMDELDRIRLKNGIKVTDNESEFVQHWNAYKKETCLFGEFNRELRKKNIEPVRCCPQGSFTQRLGGKSEKTKEKRSITPYGFSLAFYEANKDYLPVF